VVSEIAAAVGGAVAEAGARRLFEWRRDEQADWRALRRRHAEAVVPRLDYLRWLLSRAEVERNPGTWAQAVISCIAVLDGAEAVLPWELRRIKHSMRDAVGTAVGMGLVDLLPTWEPELSPFDRVWSQYAQEYLELAIYRLQTWQNMWSNRRAAKVQLPTFNTWLADTGRHRSGEVLDGTAREQFCSCP